MNEKTLNDMLGSMINNDPQYLDSLLEIAESLYRGRIQPWDNQFPSDIDIELMSSHYPAVKIASDALSNAIGDIYKNVNRYPCDNIIKTEFPDLYTNFKTIYNLSVADYNSR
jgi:hypothetical protein